MIEPNRAGRWVATFGAVLGVELRRWRRQPLAVAGAVLLPVGLAALISAAVGDLAEMNFTVAVVDQEHSPAAAAFVDGALGHPAVEPLIDVVPVANEQRANRLFDDDTVDVVVVLPPDLGRRLVTHNDAGIRVRAATPMAGDLTVLVVDQFVARARADAVAMARTGAQPTGAWPLEVTVSAPDGRRLDAAAHYGPGVGMFFVLTTLGFAAHRFAVDRRREVVSRLAATPQAMSAVLAGRTTAAVAVGGLSLAATAGAMGLLFGRSWGPPGAVAVLVLAVVVALAGVAALLAVVSRTPEQAQTLTAVVAFLFALLSGTFSPPGSVGLRSGVAELVPTTHALDGFALLATEPAAGLGSVATPVVVLLAMGLAGMATAGRLARRVA